MSLAQIGVISKNEYISTIIQNEQIILMNVGENVEVASIAKVREEKLEDEMEKNTTEE